LCLCAKKNINNKKRKNYLRRKKNKLRKENEKTKIDMSNHINERIFKVQESEFNSRISRIENYGGIVHRSK